LGVGEAVGSGRWRVLSRPIDEVDIFNVADGRIASNRIV
jgi:hypothetical protein